MFSLRHLIFLHLLWFLYYAFSVNGIQDAKQNTLDIDSKLKYLEGIANQEIEKIKFCSKANITNYVEPEDNNVIKVIFKLRDEKFQGCFKFFKIFLKKKRRVLKEIIVPYLQKKQKEVSYTFENISCGIYEVFIQPCLNDRSCLQFMWSYGDSINVTSEECLGILKKDIFSSEHKDGRVILISVIMTFCFLLTAYLFVCYKYVSPQRKKLGKESCVTGPEYIRIATCELKFVHIYIFHKYDKGNVMKIKAETLGNILTVLLKHLLDATGQRELELSLYSSIKFISSDLAKILFNVDDWLNVALKLRIEDDSLRRIILLESEIEEEEEDCLENLIFSELNGKLANSTAQDLNDYDNLFVVRLSDTPTNSNEFGNIVRRARYNCPANVVDLCLDLFCGSGLYVPQARKDLKILLQQRLAEHLNLV